MFDWRAIYLFAAGINIILAFIIVRMIPETPDREKYLTQPLFTMYFIPFTPPQPLSL